MSLGMMNIKRQIMSKEVHLTYYIIRKIMCFWYITTYIYKNSNKNQPLKAIT